MAKAEKRVMTWHHNKGGVYKPPGYEKYMTMGEVANLVNRHRRRITQLEETGVIAAPIRIKVGRMSMRLYDDKEVAAIVKHFKTAKPGRPKVKV